MERYATQLPRDGMVVSCVVWFGWLDVDGGGRELGSSLESSPTSPTPKSLVGVICSLSRELKSQKYSTQSTKLR